MTLVICLIWLKLNVNLPHSDLPSIFDTLPYHWVTFLMHMALSMHACINNTSWSTFRTDSLAPTLTGCPTSQSVLAPPLETSAIVMWSTPSATDNSGEAITVVLEKGSASGSTFEEGDQLITYSATDSARNKATCSFIVTVEGRKFITKWSTSNRCILGF